MVKSGGHQAEVIDGPSGFDGFVAVLFGGQCVMKLPAGIQRSVLGEHEWTAHHCGVYTNGWRVTLASTEVTYPSLIAETGKALAARPGCGVPMSGLTSRLSVVQAGWTAAIPDRSPGQQEHPQAQNVRAVGTCRSP